MAQLGQQVQFTNLDKVLYPVTGTTKADVIGYLIDVTDAVLPVLPVLAGRPVTRNRWPNGTDAPAFYTKGLDAGTPSWLPRVQVLHGDGPKFYPLVDSPAALAWLGRSPRWNCTFRNGGWTPRGVRWP